MKTNKNTTGLPSDYAMTRAEEQAALTSVYEKIEDDDEHMEQYVNGMIELYAEKWRDCGELPF